MHCDLLLYIIAYKGQYEITIPVNKYAMNLTINRKSQCICYEILKMIEKQYALSSAPNYIYMDIFPAQDGKVIPTQHASHCY